jgi:hypothetical protein
VVLTGVVVREGHSSAVGVNLSWGERLCCIVWCTAGSEYLLGRVRSLRFWGILLVPACRHAGALSISHHIRRNVMRCWVPNKKTF